MYPDKSRSMVACRWGLERKTWGRKITKGHEEAWSNACVHYTDCSDGFMGFIEKIHFKYSQFVCMSIMPQ